MRAMEVRPTIGLEIHAELATHTKMFCSCKNDPDEDRPNINVCPVCLAHPGTLPTINEEAVHHILKIGTAVGGTLADFSEFDRKSYFYPDIPKGYQISQYEHPLVFGGTLVGVELTRIHLEEDTARSIHVSDRSLVDFNRAGIPLMELVTEPVITDAQTAGAFARELQLLLRTLGASDANLEKGEMRIEANVSVSQEEGRLGTKVEVKNLNSFRSFERAIAHEVSRQTTALEKGEGVLQETRGWNEARGETFSQRLKEGSADYRYFPEPDLPKLFLSEVRAFNPETLLSELPELPSERRRRYANTFGLKEEDVAFLVATPERTEFFDTLTEELDADKILTVLATNYYVSDLAGIAGKMSASSFAKLIRMLRDNLLSSRGAKDTLAVMQKEGGDPETIAKDKGLIQVHDTGELKKAALRVIEEHKGVADDYRAGKEAALQYLVGQAMKATKGAGNPKILREILVEELKK
jgi:aspartyl-tRNA(Asn)/glutamyl-tRNA(Gln) amidotransferase subunit B